jgi:RND superfamily putative drug exporter
MFRSIAVPLEALFVNVLSLSATFGILVWMFQYGHLSKLLGFTSLGSIDSTQPVLIFGIAFGLSMDYSVFLFSRIKEQYDQSHDVRQSIADGLDKTGTIITSAAILFIVVVAAFATSSISLIKQIGIGLGLAVFIDAFLVRMLLMPAIMSIVGHANWWGPKWMRRRTPSGSTD